MLGCKELKDDSIEALSCCISLLFQALPIYAIVTECKENVLLRVI